MEKSIGIDDETYDRLSVIAKRNGRNLIGQIRYWVSLEVKK